MVIDIIFGLIVGIIFFIFDNNYLNIILSIIFSILPDLDFILYHIFNPINRFSHKHRRILHFPILYLILGLVLLKIFNSDQVLYFIFVITSLWHFVHDTFSIGFGVQWLFPFINRLYFLNKNIETSKKVFGNIYSDTPKNIDCLADKNGDDNWMRKSLLK